MFHLSLVHTVQNFSIQLPSLFPHVTKVREKAIDLDCDENAYINVMSEML